MLIVFFEMVGNGGNGFHEIRNTKGEELDNRIKRGRKIWFFPRFFLPLSS